MFFGLNATELLPSRINSFSRSLSLSLSLSPSTFDSFGGGGAHCFSSKSSLTLSMMCLHLVQTWTRSFATSARFAAGSGFEPDPLQIKIARTAFVQQLPMKFSRAKRVFMSPFPIHRSYVCGAARIFPCYSLFVSLVTS